MHSHLNVTIRQPALMYCYHFGSLKFSCSRIVLNFTELEMKVNRDGETHCVGISATCFSPF